jgi:hypothetical protein
LKNCQLEGRTIKLEAERLTKPHTGALEPKAKTARAGSVVFWLEQKAVWRCIVIRDWAEYDRTKAAQDEMLYWHEATKTASLELLDRVYGKSLELSARLNAFLDGQRLRTRAESCGEYNTRGVAL